MTEFDYPELSLKSVDLAPSDPQFRRASTAPRELLSDRLHFGGPVAVPIGTNDVDVDTDLVAFIRGEAATARYVLVHSALTFHSDPGDPEFESAEVLMDLSDETGTLEVIAWSLLPQSAAMPFETSRGFALGPSLKLSGVDLTVGSVDGTTTRHGHDVFLRAIDELTSHAGWKFQRTPTVELDGSYRLVMIVRASALGKAQLSVTLAATVRASGLRPRRFRSVLPLGGVEGPSSKLEF